MDWAQAIAERGGEGIVVTGGEIRFDRVRLKVAWTVQAEAVAALFEAAEMLRGAERLGLRARLPFVRDRALAQAIARASLATDQSARVVGPNIALTVRYRTWVTSHQQGDVEVEVAWVEVSGLPRDPDLAGRFLAALARAARAHLPTTEGGTCRFCGKTFAALDFHKSLTACHGCAEEHLGVIH